jgi:hypothetical protein
MIGEALRKTRAKLSGGSIYFCAKLSTPWNRWARPDRYACGRSGGFIGLHLQNRILASSFGRYGISLGEAVKYATAYWICGIFGTILVEIPEYSEFLRTEKRFLGINCENAAQIRFFNFAGL